MGLTLSLAPKYEADSERRKGAPASEDDEEEDFDWGWLNVESELMIVAKIKCNKITSIFSLSLLWFSRIWKQNICRIDNQLKSLLIPLTWGWRKSFLFVKSNFWSNLLYVITNGNFKEPWKLWEYLCIYEIEAWYRKFIRCFILAFSLW